MGRVELSCDMRYKRRNPDQSNNKEFRAYPESDSVVIMGLRPSFLRFLPVTLLLLLALPFVAPEVADMVVAAIVGAGTAAPEARGGR